MDPQDRVIGFGADEESGRHHDAVVHRLAVDVFDPVNAFDDSLKGFSHEFDGVGRFETIGFNANVDHRNADLRFLLARNGQKCE